MLLNGLQSLSYGFDIMRSMLFQGEAGDAKKSIIAGKTDDAKLLFWMDLAKSLVESRFRAIAP